MWFTKSWREKRRINKIKALGGVFTEQIAVPVLEVGGFSEVDYYGLGKAHERCPELWRWLKTEMNELEARLLGSLKYEVGPAAERERVVIEGALSKIREVYVLPGNAIAEIQKMELKEKQESAFKNVNNLGMNPEENERENYE